MLLEVGEQLAGVDSLSSCGSWGSNSACQPRQQAPVPTEPPHRPRKIEILIQSCVYILQLDFSLLNNSLILLEFSEDFKRSVADSL